MDIEKNKSIVMRHYKEVLSQQKLDVIDEIYAPVIELENGKSLSREEFKALAGRMATAFSDVVITISVQIAEADNVATCFKASGTHTGTFLGVSASGKRIQLNFMHFHVIENGRIKKLYEYFDMYGAQKQLGIKSIIE